jgi:hypothetical protein
MLPKDDGDNINGPSLVKIPDWVEGRIAKYYLYFAHHYGKYIRMAYANSLTGPWTLYEGGVLSLTDCLFLEEHIASPDVLIDEVNRRFVMYFHGRLKSEGKQRSFVAVSDDGLHFVPHPRAIGPAYARIFRHGRWHYGLFGAQTVVLSRSRDGIADFEEGPVVLPRAGEKPPRHVAVRKAWTFADVYYSRKGDKPERIFRGTINLFGDWREWKITKPKEILRPEAEYEGADLQLKRSKSGRSKKRENALRDPAIFLDGRKAWLLYSVAGESGIALGQIKTRLRLLRSMKPPR